MLATNYTNLRDNMKEYFNQIADSFEPLIVTRKDENMVIMSQSLYDSLMETVYLMGNEQNRAHLGKSIEQYRRGQAFEKGLIDD